MHFSPSFIRFLPIVIIALSVFTACNSNQKTSQPASNSLDKPVQRSLDEDQSRIIEEAASKQSTFVGMTAPSFALPDQNEQIVRLSDLNGQWTVLYFYPKDDTPGCTCQATEFTQILRSFKGQEARVIGVNADTPESHRFFIQKYDLKIQLLTDATREVMTQYGAWATIQKGEEKTNRFIRSTFLIDPEGKIAWHWPEVVPEGHAQRVYEKLSEMRTQK